MPCHSQLRHKILRQAFGGATGKRTTFRTTFSHTQTEQRLWKRARTCRMQTNASADVFALDFDEVLVDSEPEVENQLKLSEILVVLRG